MTRAGPKILLARTLAAAASKQVPRFWTTFRKFEIQFRSNAFA